MLYEEYEAKMLKLAELKKKIMRYKWLYLAIIVIMIAALIIFLAVKGIVVNQLTTTKLTYQYGEQIELSGGNGLFSDNHYEYFINNKWQTKTPDSPGTYRIRSATKTTFGYNYSNEVVITITKADLVLVYNQEIEYGEDLELKTSLGDYVIPGKYETNLVSGNLYNISLNMNILQIVNENYKGINDCYNIPNEYNLAVTINPKKITLKPKDIVKTYDSNPLDENAIKFDVELVKGDYIKRINYVFIDESGYQTKYPTNAGEYELVIYSVAIFNHYGNVSNLYDIEYENAKLIINKAELTVKTGSKEFFYSGEPYENLEYEIVSGQLYATDKLNVVSLSFVEVGTYSNDLIITSSNYNITIIPGTITIKPCELDIKPNNLTLSYQGRDLTEDIKDNLVFENDYGYDISFIGLNIIINKVETYNDIYIPEGIYGAGVYTAMIEYDSCLVNGKESEGFIIIIEEFTITVNKAKLEVSFMPEDRTYNNEKFSPRSSDLIINSGTLYNDDYLIYTFKDNGIDYLNAGNYEVEIENIFANNDNYEIQLLNSKSELKILPLEIEVLIPNQEKTYDALPFIMEDETKEFIVPGNPEVKISYLYKAKDGTIYEKPINAGTYEIIFGDVIYYNGLSTNYILNVNATLTINKASLTIKPTDVIIKYNGQNFIHDNTIETKGSIYNDDQIIANVLVLGECKNVGLYETNIESYYWLIDDQVVDINNNYEVTLEKGVLEIIPRELIYEISPIANHIYDGMTYNPTINMILALDSDQIVNGEDIIFEYLYFDPTSSILGYITPLNVGTYYLGVVVETYVNTLAINYNITLPTISFNILPRPLTISLIEVSDFIYNGQYYKYPSSSYILENGTTLAQNEEINIVVDDDDIFDVGSYEINLVDILFINCLERNYEINYNITTRTFNILKKELFASSITEKIYDGEAVKITCDGLNTNDEFIDLYYVYQEIDSGIKTNNPVDVGTYKRTNLKWQIYNKEYNLDVTSNYLIYSEFDDVTIKKRPVNIVLPQLNDVTYNQSDYLDFVDNAFGEKSFSYADNSLEFIFPATIKLAYYNVEGQPVNIFNSGTYRYELAEVITKDLANYEVFADGQTFIIHKAEIIISLTDKLEKTYDGKEFIYNGGFVILNQVDLKLEDITLKYLQSGIETIPLNAGIYNIQITNQILNYEIVLDKEYYLNIYQKNINISPVNIITTYNKEIYQYDETKFIVDSLCNEDKIISIEVSYDKTPLDVGEYKITISDVLISGNKENYSFNYNTSNLIIDPYELEVNISPISDQQYNGEMYNPTPEININNLLNGLDLKYSFSYSLNGEVKDPIEVGKYETLINWNFVNDKENNYKILVNGDLSFKITKAELVIDTAYQDSTITYNGQIHQFANYKVEKGEIFERDLENLIIKYSYYQDLELVPEIKNVGKYQIILNEFYFINSDNYEITILDNKFNLEILPNELIIDLSNYILEYGTIISNNIDEEYYSVNGLYNGYIKGLFVSYDFTENYPQVGIYNVYLDKIELVDELITNYNVKIEGNLEIIPTDLEIEIADIIDSYYDGMSKKINFDYEIIKGNFIASDDLSLSYKIYQKDTEIKDIINAGEYELRIFTANNNYNLIYEPKIFSIKPNQITVNINNLTRIYDEKEVNIDDLISFNVLNYISGEEIKINYSIYQNNKLKENIINAGNYQIEVSGFNIINGLKTNYEIVSSNIGIIEIQKRIIHIKTSSLETTYDGKNHSSREFEIVNKVDLLSAVLQVIEYSEIKFVGSCQNVLKLSYLNNLNQDVSLNYETIIDEYGILKINPRSITITSNSSEKTYDGTPLTNDLYEVDNLASTDNVFISSSPSITYYGQIENHLEYVIKNKNEDVTYCYDIKEVFGYLKINKLDITITNKVNEFDIEYKGEVSFNQLYNYELAFSDVLNVSFSQDINEILKKVGEYELIISDINILNSNGLDVTSSYNISNNTSLIKLKVLKAKLIFISKDYTFVPSPLDKEGYSYPYYEEEGLKDGDEIIITSYNIINIGNLEIENKLDYDILCDGISVIDNYDIENTYGMLSIAYDTDLLDLKIENKTYQDAGYRLEDLDIYKKYYDETLNGLKIPAVSTYSDELIAGLYYLVQVEEFNYKDIGRYSIKITNKYLVDDNNNVISDYIKTDREELRYELNIERINISVKAKDYEKDYDGLAFIHPEDGYQIIEGKLLSNHRFVLLDTNYDLEGGIVDAGNYLITIINYKIVDEMNNDVTNLYNVKTKAIPNDRDEVKQFRARVKVNRLTAYVYSQSQTFDYDGKAHSYTVGSMIKSGLLNGHYHEINEAGFSVSRAGSFKNRVRFNIYDEFGNVVTQNYKFNYDDCGTLTINKANITIEIKYAEKTYDGLPLTSTSYEVIGLENLEGFRVDDNLIKEALAANAITNVGEIVNTISLFDVVIYQDSLNVTRNFNITIIPNRLVVK